MKYFKLSLKIIITLSVIFIAVFELSYYYGTNSLPVDKSPIGQNYSEQLLDITWLTLDCNGERELTSIYFYNIFSKSNRSPVNISAREILNRKRNSDRRNLIWQYQYFVASIWVSRNWTADDALNTLLNNANFGEEIVGIENASRYFYNLDVKNLRVAEVVVLLTILKGPDFYDPYKNRERLFARVQKLLENLKTVNLTALNLEKNCFERLLKSRL